VRDWNVVVTALPARERFLLDELNQLGTFHRSGFKGVLTGRVEAVDRFLEDVRQALEEGAGWARDLARVLPVERTFSFEPDAFVERLKEAVAPFLQRMDSGTFYVRLQRRGHKGRIVSPEVERAVDEHLVALAEHQGKTLRVAFQDPDYVVAVETVGSVCGVALLPRELRTRYPFVKIK